MGLAYLFGMRFEELNSRNFLLSVKARYAAESGVNYASAVLENDESLGFDSYLESWSSMFLGNAFDNDSDGIKDSAWLDLGEGIKCAVKVVDNNSKIPLNAPWFSLTRPLEDLVKSHALSQKAQMVILNAPLFLKGPDKAWGILGVDDNYNRYFVEHNGIDDDFDGEIDELGEGIDEPWEFLPYHPVGDDKLLLSTDLSFLGDYSNKDAQIISGVFTAYSKAGSLNVESMPMLNINYVPVNELSRQLLKAGVSNAWQVAVNLRDFLDRDLVRTTLFADTVVLSAYKTSILGDWKFNDGVAVCETGNCEESAKWRWQGLAQGSYYCYLYGDDDYVGSAVINKAEISDIKSGEKLGQIVVIGSDRVLELELICNKEGQSCSFRSLKLVPTDAKNGGLTVSGMEGVRITEIYSSPKVFLSAGDAQVIRTGAWVNSGGIFTNSSANSGASGQGHWRWSGLKDGNYYVEVFGKEGERVGDVSCSWSNKTNHIIDGEWMSSVSVVSGGELNLRVENNEPEGTTCYFSGIMISQEPDVEFIELTNITSQSIDISGWYFIVPDMPQWPAFIPQGTVIKPGESLVFCADPYDKAQFIAGNMISAVRSFSSVDVTVFKPLDFAIDLRPGLDVIPDSGVLHLCDERGNVVDGVDLSQCKAFSSIYKAALSNEDSNNNGEFDGWVISDEDRNPDPGASEIDEDYVFLNGPVYEPVSLSIFGEGLAEKLSDVFSFYGIDLYPLGRAVSGWTDEEWGALSSSKMQNGRFLWQNLPDFGGRYYNIVLQMSPGEGVIPQVYTGKGWEKYQQTLWADSSGLIDLGWTQLYGTDFKLKLSNASKDGICHLYGVHIGPNYHRYGVINLNTASKQAIMALPVSDRAIEAIKSASFEDKIGKGLGQLADKGLSKKDLAVIFRMCGLNSSSYTIISTGAVELRDKIKSKRRVVAVVERD